MEKVIIIGAGPAGLTAAYELLKNDQTKEIIILEESNQVGGISKTIFYHGNRMDIGGHRFFSKDEEIMNFWKMLLPIQGKNAYDDEKLNRKKQLEEGGPSPDETDEVMLIRDRISRIYYLNTFFDYPISFQFATLKKMGIWRVIKAGVSYIKAILFPKEETNLENFYINRFGKELYNMFFKQYTEKVWGRSPSQISSDWGSQRVKGVSILKIFRSSFQKKFFPKKKQEIVETSLIEQFWYPKYGPGQLWETLAQKIENLNGKIAYNHQVTSFQMKNGKIRAVTCMVKGKIKVIEGDIFISSMPLKDLIMRLPYQEVPKTILEIAKGLPYRDFITVGVLVKKINWKNETSIKTLGNIIPDCWLYIQDEKVKMGRIQIFNNWSPYLVKDVENTVWIGLEYFLQENDEYWNRSETEMINFACQELMQIGLIEKEDILDYHLEKVKKAYPAYFDTYDKIEEIRNYINQIPNLYCIGRNGQHRYNNMDHSMKTAIKAVEHIRGYGTSKEDIWNVNTEKEYHEEKKRREGGW